MNEYNHLSHRLALAQIDERVQTARRLRAAGGRQPSPRHRIATGLHHLADRLDA